MRKEQITTEGSNQTIELTFLETHTLRDALDLYFQSETNAKGERIETYQKEVFCSVYPKVIKACDAAFKARCQNRGISV